MPRKLRTSKQQRPVTDEELEHRAKWAGVLTPELSVEDSNRLEAHRHGQTSWVPTDALNFLWDRVDGVHGEPWVWSEFLVALGQDRAEVEQVARDHPEQADRLQRFLVDLEQVARDRDEGAGRVGERYEVLGKLGYSGGQEVRRHDD